MKKILTLLLALLLVVALPLQAAATGAGDTELPPDNLHEHSWDEGVVTTEPTCEQDGVLTYTCTTCGESREEILPATGHIDEDADGKCDICQAELDTSCEHSWDEGVVTSEPTCKDEGVMTYTCSLCGQTREEPIAKLDHDWDEGTVTKAPSVWEEGEMTFTCRLCEEQRTEPIAKLEQCDGGDECASRLFTDVPAPSNWAHAGIDFCVHTGLMVGSSETTFAPNAVTTRAMIVAILYRLQGSPAVEYKQTFSDVADEKWFTSGVIWAADNGIVSGYGNGKFGPNDSITREQLTSILLRYTIFSGFQTDALAELSSFTDAPKAGSWSELGLRWALQEKLIYGTAATQLSPSGKASRAQLAAILMRYIESAANMLPVEDPETCTHNYRLLSTIAGTCLSEGAQIYHCGKCNDTYSKPLPLGDHKYVGQVTKAATCKEAGVKTFTCSVCGKSYTEAIPQVSHDYQNGSCRYCGQTEPNLAQIVGSWYSRYWYDTDEEQLHDLDKMTAGLRFPKMRPAPGTMAAQSTI